MANGLADQSGIMRNVLTVAPCSGGTSVRTDNRNIAIRKDPVAERAYRSRDHNDQQIAAVGEGTVSDCCRAVRNRDLLGRNIRKGLLLNLFCRLRNTKNLLRRDRSVRLHLFFAD